MPANTRKPFRTSLAEKFYATIHDYATRLGRQATKGHQEQKQPVCSVVRKRASFVSHTTVLACECVPHGETEGPSRLQVWRA